MAFLSRSLGLLVHLWFKKNPTISCVEVLVLNIRDNIRECIVNCSSDIFITGSQRRERTEGMEGSAEPFGIVLED